MYVVTFFSFKGGVGRTLALANLAAALANMGRRVLVVDFDLEAPGLDTFDAFRLPQSSPGLVDFVTEYLRADSVPAVAEFVHASRFAPSNKGGGIWIMPAGRRNQQYRSDLAAINWLDLYEHRDGFLLFEDLKQQWMDTIRPDYVLIDSRTGHSDVEGICTRQFPDAVVLMFFPNDQNLIGVKETCRQIRRERTRGLRKEVKLHFVMSNVPDLDDEDEILKRRISLFQREMEIPQFSAIIHRYESLHLLNQDLFLIDRPRSRLAKEYQQLLNAILVENLADRDGALLYLNQWQEKRRETSLFASSRMSEAKLGNIVSYFSDDADMLVQVAHAQIAERSFVDAKLLLDKAIALQPDCAQGYFLRANCQQKLGHSAEAVADLRAALAHPGLDTVDIVRVVRELLIADEKAAKDVIALPAISGLDVEGKSSVAGVLSKNAATVEIANALLREVLASDGPEIIKLAARNNIGLNLIFLKQWKEACEVYEDVNNSPSLDRPFAFNYAMAFWGWTGELSEAHCRRVTELPMLPSFVRVSRNLPGLESRLKEIGDTISDAMADEPNYNQCMAVVAWRLGDKDQAIKRLEIASRAAAEKNQPVFSCWSYQEVTPNRFVEECGELRRMVEGDNIKPRFLRNDVLEFQQSQWVGR